MKSLGELKTSDVFGKQFKKEVQEMVSWWDPFSGKWIQEKNEMIIEIKGTLETTSKMEE